MSDGIHPCFLCKDELHPDADYVMWVLNDGRLVRVCGICLDKVDRDEPYFESLTYEETTTHA